MKQDKTAIKTFFVSFYKGMSHHLFYMDMPNDKKLVRDFVKNEYGKVTDLVIDRVA